MIKNFKLLGIIALTAAIGFSLTACPPEEPLDQNTDDSNTSTAYIITGTAGKFTATKGEKTVTGAENADIDTVLSAIKADAIGENITVQFGNGTETLDLGTGYTSSTEASNPGAIFSGTGWGTVTITGKVKANRGGYQSDQLVGQTMGFIGVNGIINADITNTNNLYSAVGVRTTSAVKNTLIVNSGTITGGSDGSTGYGIAAFNDSLVTVNGGTISGGIGINLANNASAIVKGGTITGKTTAGIYIIGENLTVVSGTIQGTGNASAIFANDKHTITLSGDSTVIISSAPPSAYNNRGATIILNNGYFATTGSAGTDTQKATLIIGENVTIKNSSTDADKREINNINNKAVITDNRSVSK